MDNYGTRSITVHLLLKPQGTAVGYNKENKGARSYYPLFCTIAQTGQVLDVLHRSGNVHDSKGALEFVTACVQTVRERLGNSVRLEARLDSAFFSDAMVQRLEQLGVEYSISVPFERFTALQGIDRKT
jgi:Transposase DDE domain group 1